MDAYYTIIDIFLLIKDMEDEDAIKVLEQLDEQVQDELRRKLAIINMEAKMR
jgi:hypothetical protein